MAIALPLYLNAITESARRTARSNMNMLINVEQAYRTQNHAYTNKMSDLTDPASKYLDQEPIGPGDLHYYVLRLAGDALPDGRTAQIPAGGVASCATAGTSGKTGSATYGCYIPGVDAE